MLKKLTWNKLYNESVLYKSSLKLYTKSLFSKRKGLTTAHDDKTLFDFATHGSKNLQKLHSNLIHKRFSFTHARAHDFNFNGKIRTIYIYPWEEKIVDTMLFNTLNEHFDYYLSPSTYAYRCQGFGVDACQNNIKYFIRSQEQPLYIIKRDITKYFPSIDHNILIEKLKTLIDEDDYLFKLLEQRIKFKYVTKDNNEIQTATKGAPFGCPIACFFANLYLVEMDRHFNQYKSAKYFRYADDILLVTPDREEAVQAVKDFDMFMEKLNLKSKPKHHKNLLFSEKKIEDIEFDHITRFKHLGLQYRADGSIGLSKDKFRKICNLFKFAFRRKYLKKALKPMQRAETLVSVANNLIEYGVRAVSIIDYYLKHVDDEKQLKLIDRWVAEEILARSLQAGHKKGNFRKIPYKKLRQMGLISLVHRKRLIGHGHIVSSFFIYRNDAIRRKY